MECMRGHELGPITFDEYGETPNIFLAMLWNADSKQTGTHVDEDGKEHEVWQHVFTPPGPKEPPVLRFANGTELCFTSLDFEALKGVAHPWSFTVSTKVHHRFLLLHAQARRRERLWKLKKRQRRHAQRKHCQGRTYHK